MKEKYAMIVLCLFCFAGIRAQVAKKDTLYLQEDVARLLYNHNAGYRIINKDTMVWIGRKERPIGADNRQIVANMIRYDIAGDSLNPISVIGDKNTVIETYYTNGEEKIGPYKKYWDNGQLKVEGNYSPETYFKKLGRWTWYDKQGQVRKVKDYQ